MLLSSTRRCSLTVLVGLLVVSVCGDDDTASEAAATQSTSIAEVAATATPSSTPSTVEATTTVAPSGTANQGTTTEPTPTSIAAQSPEAMLAELTEDQIASVGGHECALEAAVVGTAYRQFFEACGIEPLTIGELVDSGYLAEPLRRWELSDLRVLQPMPGSGCINPETSATCKEQARILTLACLAYLAANPDAAEPTLADLLDAGLLGELVAGLDLIDGAVIADPGEACDGIDVTVDWEQQCAIEARTLETALEAYRAMEGSWPASEAELVTATLLRSESLLVDLSGEIVVPAPGGPCEGIELS